MRSGFDSRGWRKHLYFVTCWPKKVEPLKRACSFDGYKLLKTLFKEFDVTLSVSCGTKGVYSSGERYVHSP